MSININQQEPEQLSVYSSKKSNVLDATNTIDSEFSSNYNPNESYRSQSKDLSKRDSIRKNTNAQPSVSFGAHSHPCFCSSQWISYSAHSSAVTCPTILSTFSRVCCYSIIFPHPCIPSAAYARKDVRTRDLFQS